MMNLNAASCLTCRVLRRFVFAFGTGALLAWMLTGRLPFDVESAPMMQGLVLVAVMFAALTIFLRMREMRARFRRMRSDR